MITIALILAVLALLFTVLDIMGKVPLWVAVLLLCLLALIQAAGPMGR